ncbi:MAG TPA: transglycosylase domain-containing protein [Ktedonobacteraceae bacterium]|nr:transglycosylase domain-containing protein [Ktedonobacteraceae bacterium]
MDEYNDSKYDEVRSLVDATSGGERTLMSYTGREESLVPLNVATLSEWETPLTTSGKLEALSVAQRRTRMNHFVLMKRRQRRFQENMKASMRPLILFIVFLIVLVSLISSSLGGAYAFYQSQLPLLNGMANHTLFQSTRIYDREGRLLYELYDPRYGRRTYVNYNDISPLLINATVAAEDHTFWTNSGVDVQGTIRAAIANLQNDTVVEGGSTITQQLIKNQLYLDQARSVEVKGQEAILAYGLTQQYPKWKIIEMYLNTVYYGDLNYGIEAAAQNYFNIQPKCTSTRCVPAVAQLDLAQASMLAGLPQSPSYYDPTSNKPAALARQKLVLQSMVDLNMITAKQAQQAEIEIAKYKFMPFSHNIQAPHFVHYVIDQVLVPMLSSNGQDGAQILYDGGFNIYTTLDLDVEKHIEQLTYDHLYKVNCDNYLGCYGPLNTQNNVNNAAVVVMDPANGEILAMNGSANYNDNNPKVDGNFNAALSPRQPGSSMKPFVYATAFEMGWYPAMILQDHQTIFPTRDGNGWYTPQNYDGRFHTGFPMTVRNAIANSFNIPALDAMEFTGIQNVLNTAARFGLTEIASRSPSSLGPSLALGTAEVSLLHLTSAYATFANRGVRIPPTSVLEITDNVGHSLYTYNAAHPQGVRAVREDVAFLMSSILADKASRYHEFGPGNPLELDRPAAAKTGTTNSFRDNWTVGYTPYLTVGVWAGNSDNSAMNNVIGITGAGPIWHDVMEYVSHYYNYPPDDFIKPADVQAGTVSALTGLLPHPGEPTVTDWFIDGTMPTIQGPYTPPRSHCHGDVCHPNPIPICPFPFTFCGVPPTNNNALTPNGLANGIRK